MLKMRKYRLMTLMKSGATVVAADAESLEDIDHKVTSLEKMMLNPTVDRLVFRQGTRLTAVKEIEAAWVEECGEGDE